MSQADAKRKRVVILGGGLGGLTAAYYLSDTPELRAKYDVTVFQTGWRLGGKCASGRNSAMKCRIEEHGVHVFSGFYTNTFTMLRACYEELDRPSGTPLSTCTGGANPAFEPHNRLSLMEKLGDDWNRWDLVFEPDRAHAPGGRPRSHKLWHDLKKMSRMLQQEYDRLTNDQKRELRTKIKKNKKFRVLVRRTTGRAGLKKHLKKHELFDVLANMPRPSSQRGFCRKLAGACTMVKKLLGALHVALRAPDRLSDDVRHFVLMANLGLAIVRGVLKHRVLQRGFDVIDNHDFAEWLRKHGASTHVCESAIVQSLYAAVFAYQPDGKLSGQPRLAAGVALRVLWRTFFGYRGGFLWKMQAGMGDTVVAPLYEVLKKRQVKFEFFHRVDRLELSSDKKSIGCIHITRQVALKTGEYDPLLYPGKAEGIDVPSWPSEPRYEQIEDNQASLLRKKSTSQVNLESPWFKWEHEQPRTPLVAGQDFDAVVLAIPVGALPPVCRDLIQQNRKWKQMIQSLATTQTQAVQLWFNRSAIDLGWDSIAEEPLVVGYQKPLDSWVGMSQLLDREQWSLDDDVRHIAYFVTTEVDDQPLDKQLLDTNTPMRQHKQIEERTKSFLRKEFRRLWPNATVANSTEFDWRLLVDPDGRTGQDRLQAQYLRANVNPSDRYVLSLPGTTTRRLRPDESQFKNLFLAGDWTRNGMNVGCAEATVMSGMQAARALTERKLRIPGEKDPKLPSLSPFCRWRRRWRRRVRAGAALPESPPAH